jgi:hypothetical protein
MMNSKRNIYEFILEIVMANNLASVHKVESANFKTELLDFVRSTAIAKLVARPLNVDAHQRSEEELVVDFESFLIKVANREELLRAKMAKPLNLPDGVTTRARSRDTSRIAK